MNRSDWPDAEADDVEEHLACCAACRSDLAAAVQVLRSLPKRRRWLFAAPVAAAAAIAMLLVFPSDRIEPPSDVLRSGETIADREGRLTIEAVAPAPGEILGTDSVVFVWHAIDTDAAYRITLSEENGDVVWSASTSDTTISLPSQIELMPDRVYLWYVDGLRRDIQPATTGVIEFHTSP